MSGPKDRTGKPIHRHDFVVGPDGFEGWYMWSVPAENSRGDGAYGPYVAVVCGPLGIKRYRFDELRIVPRTDIPSK